MYDFVLITPCYHGVSAITCWCVERAHLAGLNFIWVFGKGGRGDALLPRDRSVAVTTFMEHGQSDHMIFLDSDIVFYPEHLAQLNAHQKAGYDIIGGMYPLRSGTGPASYSDKPIPEKPGVIEIKFLSTGFMGISKYALQKIVKEYKYPDGSSLPLLHANTEGIRSYPFFEVGWTCIEKADEDGSNYVWLSEDWDFCEKARAVGLKVHADTGIQLGHQADRIVTFHDVEAYRRKLLELQAQKEHLKKQEYVDYVGESSKE